MTSTSATAKHGSSSMIPSEKRPHVMASNTMNNWRDKLSLDKISGIMTWAVVAGMSLFVLHKNNADMASIVLASALYLVYIVGWLFMIRDRDYQSDGAIRSAILIMLFAVVIGIFFTVPLSFNSILMGIISGALPYYVNVKKALMIGTIASFPLYFVFTYYWQDDFVFLTASLFWTFNMFAIIMVNATVKEKAAREKVEETNRQLVSTQALLKEASKQSERIRIARNIHDLLGHHLTALTINLQVASIKAEGDVKKNVEQCHQLAKLLLSDVRDAVSDIRDKSQVDLHEAINSMAKQVPFVDIELIVSDNLHIDDIEIADALLKCVQESITNTIKHAKGKTLLIDISQNETALSFEVRNSGTIPKTLKIGNGLKGMQERINLLGGRITFSLQPTEFITSVVLPINSEQQP
ncbi:sensor histidine kinase [Glaciecola siphonariae]|uniref:Sensor histidine kinase n=1 Tax=Glaciecola siphonariae TaxID=521012 RepID=A0ABV9M087_9ALTE